MPPDVAAKRARTEVGQSTTCTLTAIPVVELIGPPPFVLPVKRPTLWTTFLTTFYYCSPTTHCCCSYFPPFRCVHLD